MRQANRLLSNLYFVDNSGTTSPTFILFNTISTKSKGYVYHTKIVKTQAIKGNGQSTCYLSEDSKVEFPRLLLPQRWH